MKSKAVDKDVVASCELGIGCNGSVAGIVVDLDSAAAAGGRVSLNVYSDFHCVIYDSGFVDVLRDDPRVTNSIALLHEPSSAKTSFSFPL